MPSPRLLAHFAAAALLFVLLPAAAQPQDPVWVGAHQHDGENGDPVSFGDGTSWNDPQNWHAGTDTDGDAIHRTPDSGDMVHLDVAQDVTLTSDGYADSLRLDMPASRLVISTGDTLHVDGLRVDAAHAEGGGAVRVREHLLLPASTDPQIFDGVALLTEGTADCRDGGVFFGRGATLGNSGLFTNSAGYCQLNFGSGVTIENSGTMESIGTGTYVFDGSYVDAPEPYPVFHNTGTLRTGVVAVLHNSGTVETPPGHILDFGAGGTSDGTFVAQGEDSEIRFTRYFDGERDQGGQPVGAAWDLTGATFSGNGQVSFWQLDAPVTLTDVTYDLDAATGETNVNGSTVTFPAAMDLTSLGATLYVSYDTFHDLPALARVEHDFAVQRLSLQSGSLAGGGSVTVTEEADLHVATIHDGRAVTVEAGATGLVNDLTLLDGSSVTNHGDLTNGEGGAITLRAGSSILNHGTLHASDIGMGEGAAFASHGALTARSIDTTGTVAALPVFTNTGLLHVDTYANDLTFGVGLANSGELRLGQQDGLGPEITVTGLLTNEAGGLVTGTGVLALATGDGTQLVNDGAFSPGIAPDDPAGAIEVQRPFDQRTVALSTGEGLTMEILGTDDQERDHLVSTGRITLDGALDLTVGDAVPLGAYQLVLSQYEEVRGTFGQVQVDAPGYTYDLQYHNDQAYGNHVTLEITGTPHPILAAHDDEVDFFSAQVGDTETFVVENVGSGTLTLSGATFAGADAEAFALAGPSFPVTLATGETADVMIEVVGPARASEASAQLEIAHDGDGDGAATTSVAVLADEITNPHFGGGGSDYGGYYFANSTSYADGAPSQPQYDWIDVSGSGTDRTGDLGGGDVVAGPYSLGFTFRFFGQDHTQYWIDANGYLAFSDPGSSAYANEEIPYDDAPNNLVAWFWDDLDPTDADVSGTHVYTSTTTVNGRDAHVVTFERYPEDGASADEWITAQVVLIAGVDAATDGTIKLQYHEHGAGLGLDGATVGIENASGTEGLPYRYDGGGGPLFGSPLAVQMGPTPSALPVELASFEAARDGEAVHLSWQTLSETSNAGFDVQRRTEGAWTSLAFVEGAGTTADPQAYTFVDEDVPCAAETVHYRLAQRDRDGSVSHSRSVEVAAGTPERLALHGNAPNPFQRTTTIRYELPTEAHVHLEVFDALGRRVALLADERQEAGRKEIDFDASALPAGVYVYRLQAGDAVETRRIVLVR